MILYAEGEGEGERNEGVLLWIVHKKKNVLFPHNAIVHNMQMIFFWVVSSWNKCIMPSAVRRLRRSPCKKTPFTFLFVTHSFNVCSFFGERSFIRPQKKPIFRPTKKPKKRRKRNLPTTLNTRLNEEGAVQLKCLLHQIHEFFACCRSVGGFDIGIEWVLCGFAYLADSTPYPLPKDTQSMAGLPKSVSLFAALPVWLRFCFCCSILRIWYTALLQMTVVIGSCCSVVV